MIRHVYCPGEVLERVQLIDVVGVDPAIGDDDDRRLWEIVAIEASDPAPDRIVVGDAPPSFREAVPLKGALQPGRSCDPRRLAPIPGNRAGAVRARRTPDRSDFLGGGISFRAGVLGARDESVRDWLLDSRLDASGDSTLPPTG